jgi:hypothetical protein
MARDCSQTPSGADEHPSEGPVLQPARASVAPREPDRAPEAIQPKTLLGVMGSCRSCATAVWAAPPATATMIAPAMATQPKPAVPAQTAAAPTVATIPTPMDTRVCAFWFAQFPTALAAELIHGPPPAVEVGFVELAEPAVVEFAGLVAGHGLGVECAVGAQWLAVGVVGEQVAPACRWCR